MYESARIARKVALLSLGMAIAVLTSLAPATAQSTEPALDPHIKDAIQLLGSPDPTERDQAQRTLVRLDGLDDAGVRAALKTASASDDPAIAAGAAAVVNLLPWYNSDDPFVVKSALLSYSTQGVDQRCNTIRNMMAQDPKDGVKVLLRIVAAEPSDTVRWVIVQELESTANDTAHKVTARNVPAPADSPPLLALAGWAWFDFDQARGIDDYQRAFDQWKLSPHEPTEDEAACLMDPLLRDDEILHQYDGAADVLRAMPAYKAANSELLFRLFALHAEYGPLKGYADDRAVAGEKLNSPLLRFCQARIAERMMLPKQAAAMQAKALAAAAGDIDAANDTAMELLDSGWGDLAAVQWRAVLAIPPGASAPTPEQISNARFGMASIHARDGEYQQAASDTQAGIDSMTPEQRQSQQAAAGLLPGVPGTPGIETVYTQQRWWALKAAEDSNDAAKITENLNALVAMKPANANNETDTEIVMDIVPRLTAAGRDADAHALFDPMYEQLRASLDGDPGNAEPMNELSWFCAQCGQRLDEADTLARKAVAARPNEAAFIDTLAYCEYRLGRPQEAVRLETIALSIDRNDFVMIQALDKFRAAAVAEQKRSRGEEQNRSAGP